MEMQTTKPTIILELEKEIGIEFQEVEYGKFDKIDHISKDKYFSIENGEVVDLYLDHSNLIYVPQALRKFTSLKKLNLADNKILNITDLKDLTNLADLNLSGNGLIDISVIANFKKIEKLVLLGNFIRNLTPLASLTTLMELEIGGNNFIDISALKNLTQLKKLEISGGVTPSRVDNIDALENLLELETLYITYQKLSSISALKKLKKLKILWLDFNQIVNISALENLTQLEQLRLDYNEIEDISPLGNLKELKELHLENNKITDISALKGLKKLEFLNLNNKKNKIKIEEKGVLEVIKNTSVKMLDLSDVYPYFPKELLNHTVNLYPSYSGERLDIRGYDIFPPKCMVELGYKNPQFYYENYPEDLLDKYQKATVEVKKNHPTILNSIELDTIIKEERLKIENKFVEELLSKYYHDYKSNSELNCPYSINKVIIKAYKGINELVIYDTGVNEQKKELNNPEWIFLTGENGFGKTSILRAIFIGLCGGEESDYTEHAITNVIVEYNKKDKLAINSMFIPLMYNNYTGEFLDKVAAYGAKRTDLSKDNIPAKNESLFEKTNSLYDFETMYKEWRIFPKENKSKIDNFAELMKMVIPNLSKIDIDRETSKVIYFEKTETSEELTPVTFNQLAMGMRSILAMIADLVYRLTNSKFEFTISNGVTNIEGIVLIDEFDNHLHPKWQRMLVEKLTTLFPKVQFIVSTHSPIPLLGAPPERTVILNVNRTKEEGITVRRLEKLEKELKYLLPNQLLTSDIFGLDEIENVHLTDEEFDKVPIEDKYNDIEANKKMMQELKELAMNKELFPDDLFKNKNL